MILSAMQRKPFASLTHCCFLVIELKERVLLIFRNNLRCNSTMFLESILAPSLDTADNKCQLQSQPLLFSCRAARPRVVRLCPCRSYRKEQVALCETCWPKETLLKEFFALLYFTTIETVLREQYEMQDRVDYGMAWRLIKVVLEALPDSDTTMQMV